jgi:membrane associated rhomboid family serine protease
MSNINNGGIPPTDNPILNFYENFQRDTPMVTRVVLTTQACSWALSCFLDLTYALANIPYFTITKFEIYRIFTSLFVCTSLLSLIFTYISFVETGKRLELSVGSTEFACLSLAIGILVNVLYIACAAVLDGLLGGQYWFALPSFGIWTVLFGIVALECTKAPQGSVRKIFVWTVPAIYYPFVLLAVFSVLGGFSLAHLISIGVGYGFGYGYLDKIKVSSTTCKQWEESLLESMTHQDGWVLSNASLGSGAWNEEMNSMSSGASGGGFNSLISRLSLRGTLQEPTESSSIGGGSGGEMGGPGVSMGSDDSRPGRVIKQSQNADTTETSSSTNLPTAGGRQLGGPSRRQNVDPRQARLKAIEKRMGVSQDNDPL